MFDSMEPVARTAASAVRVSSRTILLTVGWRRPCFVGSAISPQETSAQAEVWIYSGPMPVYHRTYSPGQLQFITTSTYRRAPIFLSERLCHGFVQRLEEVRQEMKFLLLGWVLMPDHFHLLLCPQPAGSTSLIVKGLKEQTAERILKTLRENLPHPWCRKMLSRLRLPSSVHDESHYRLWQRRFYPFNVYTEKKYLEKLQYMHNNPVRRGLVSSPGDWAWSSWRFYFLEDVSMLRMDRLD